MSTPTEEGITLTGGGQTYEALQEPAGASSVHPPVPQPSGKSALVEALARAQGAMRNVAFDRQNPHFKSKYASLAAILDVVREPLSTNGLAVTQTMHQRDGNPFLCTTLRGYGDEIYSYHPLPANVKPQEFGSALTYARRYSLSALLNISSDEDDDANIAQTSTAGAIITQAQIDKLQQLIADTGSDQDAICRYAKVGNLGQVQQGQGRGQYDDIIAELQSRPKTKKAKADVLAADYDPNENGLAGSRHG